MNIIVQYNRHYKYYKNIKLSSDLARIVQTLTWAQPKLSLDWKNLTQAQLGYWKCLSKFTQTSGWAQVGLGQLAQVALPSINLV